MYNSKGPTSKSFTKPKLKGKGFPKDTAPFAKDAKVDKLKPSKKK